MMKLASNAQLSRAIQSWKGITAAIRRKLTAVCERMVRASTRLLAAGWRAWITNALKGVHGSEMDRMVAELAALRQESKESRLMINMLEKAVSKHRSGERKSVLKTAREVMNSFMLHFQRSAFNKWRDAAIEIAATERLLVGVLNRMFTAQLGKGWNAWRFGLKQLDAEVAAMKVVVRALNRLLHAQLSAGWQKWCDVVRHGRAVEKGQVSCQPKSQDLNGSTQIHGNLRPGSELK